MTQHEITNSIGQTAIAHAVDGWVRLALNDDSVRLTDADVESLVTALRNAARDAADQVPFRFLDEEAASNFNLLVAIAADFWDQDEWNDEYERGQSELIRDFVRWQGWPPETSTITEHIRSKVRGRSQA